jgi:hypothetical protein
VEHRSSEPEERLRWESSLLLSSSLQTQPIIASQFCVRVCYKAVIGRESSRITALKIKGGYFTYLDSKTIFIFFWIRKTTLFFFFGDKKILLILLIIYLAFIYTSSCLILVDK